MNRSRTLPVAAGVLAALGLSPLTRGAEIEPLHVSVGNLLISYNAFDTTLEDEREDPKPRFTHKPIVCKDDMTLFSQQQTMTLSPALAFTRKELEEGFTKTYRLGGMIVGGDGAHDHAGQDSLRRAHRPVGGDCHRRVR